MLLQHDDYKFVYVDDNDTKIIHIFHFVLFHAKLILMNYYMFDDSPLAVSCLSADEAPDRTALVPLERCFQHLSNATNFVGLRLGFRSERRVAADATQSGTK